MKNLIKKVVCSLILFLIILGCSEKSDLESFIQQYDEEDFSVFYNSFVAFRSSEGIYNIYIVSKAEGDLPVYFVTVDNRTGKVIEIDNRNLVKQKQPEYFSRGKISELISNFCKYDFYLISCDKDLNVMINPNEANEPARLLRISKTNHIDIKVKRQFTYYKKNWYIRDGKN